MDIEKEDLVLAVTAPSVNHVPLAAGTHRQVTMAVCLHMHPVVAPELSAPADIHSTTVGAQLGTVADEVQHLDVGEMAVAVAVAVTWVEGKEDHSANMAEVLRRPSRTPRQGYGEGSAGADGCLCCLDGSLEGLPTWIRMRPWDAATRNDCAI